MTVKLLVKIGLSTTEDRRLIETALVEAIRDIPDYPEVRHPDDPSYVLAIIDDVEVTVR